MNKKKCLCCLTEFKPRRSTALFCRETCRVTYNRRRKTSKSPGCILSLCDFSGNWSKPYKEAGYEVIQVDLKHGQDVRLLKPPTTTSVHGILAAPPCTYFACSGNRWKRSETEIIQGLSIVDACLRFVAVCQPNWWALENPIGTLHRYLGKPTFYFNPCDYGDPYTKRTALWGKFNIPKPTPVEPTLGSFMHQRYGGNTEYTKTMRSITSIRFAYAFFQANP